MACRGLVSPPRLHHDRNQAPGMSAKGIQVGWAGLAACPQLRRSCSGCRCVPADMGGRATASDEGNGLTAVVTICHWAGLSAAGVLLPGAARGKGPERFCGSAGHGAGTWMGQDCQGVRIYCSDQCPRQDSNLRSRLRRPFPGKALTSENVIQDVLSGRVSGATAWSRLPHRPDSEDSGFQTSPPPIPGWRAEPTTTEQDTRSAPAGWICLTWGRWLCGGLIVTEAP